MRQYEYNEDRNLSKTDVAGGCIVFCCLFVIAAVCVIGSDGVLYILRSLGF